VSATNQSSYSEDYDISFRTAYDDFFAELGIADGGRGSSRAQSRLGKNR